MGVRARLRWDIERYILGHFSVISTPISAAMNALAGAILAECVKVGNLHHSVQTATNRALWGSNLFADMNTGTRLWES